MSRYLFTEMIGDKKIMVTIEEIEEFFLFLFFIFVFFTLKNELYHLT